MWLNICVPKTFLYRYNLKLGSLVYGVFFASLMALCAVVIGFQVLNFTDCGEGNSSYHLWKNAYALSVTEIIYCLFMVIINLWFICGVKSAKSSVVLAATVINTMRMAQMFVLMIILLIMYMKETSLVPWILAFIFGLIGFSIPVYGLLVSYGHYLELKKTTSNQSEP